MIRKVEWVERGTEKLGDGNVRGPGGLPLDEFMRRKRMVYSRILKNEEMHDKVEHHTFLQSSPKNPFALWSSKSSEHYYQEGEDSRSFEKSKG